MEKFDFQYKNVWQDEIQFKTLVTKFENGQEQRRSKGLPRRIFTLEFDKTTNYNDDVKKIWDFFVARKGKFEPFLFDWEKPDGTTEEITVRFDTDALSREAFLNKAYSFGLKLIEVL